MPVHPHLLISGFCDETKEEVEFSFHLMILSILG